MMRHVVIWTDSPRFGVALMYIDGTGSSCMLASERYPSEDEARAQAPGVFPGVLIEPAPITRAELEARFGLRVP